MVEENNKRIKSWYLNKERRGGKMTICIGVICDGGATVIVASDKMVTASGVSTEFEHSTPKFEKIGENCIVLSAGTALVHRVIAKAVREDVTRLSLTTIHQIVKKYEEAYSTERLNRAERNVLSPRGMSIRTFYGGQMMQLTPDLAMLLDRNISDHELGLELIVAGVDVDGGHLHNVVEPGASECFDTLGFTATGSGYLHSVALFMSCSYNSNWKSNEALYAVFEAKKRAEHAPGVGSLTDMAIITRKNKVKILEQADIEKLEQIYATKRTDENVRLKDMSITSKAQEIIDGTLV